MGNLARRLALTCIFLAAGLSFPSIPVRAATVSWTSSSPIVVEGTALKQTQVGVTIRARGFTVEYSDTSTTVFGPYPTGPGEGNLKIFGVAIRNIPAEQLGLLSQPVANLGITVAGSDRGAGGLNPGFDCCAYRVGDRTVTKLDMAMFTFSQPVRVTSIRVHDVSNAERDIWVAACSVQPDFSQGLLSVLAGCTVRNKNDDATDGPFTHRVDFGSKFRFFLVGPRPRGTKLGPITSVPVSGSFFIDSIGFNK